MIDAARRYLGIAHGAEAVTAHRAVLDLASAVARRRNDPRWRLLGIALPAPTPGLQCVSLEEWAGAEGLGDWSASELQALYEEKFGSPDAGARRRQARDARLWERRLALLHELEATAAERPMPADLLSGWLEPVRAHEFLKRGVATLGELQALIARGGRWWAGLRACGPVKAARLQRQVEQLLGPASQTLPVPGWELQPARAAALSGAHGANRWSGGRAAIEALDDRAAVQTWIAARSGSDLTARAYEREAERFILWTLLARNKALSDATAEDCRAYMDFLANLPAEWISRRRVARLAPGWAPFSGALSVASQRQAIGIVHSLFEWLVDARYLASNPWVLVRRRIGDAMTEGGDVIEASRAFTPAAWSALFVQLDAEPDAATAARTRWLLVFTEATGLRASELLRATRGDFGRRSTAKGAWWIRVHGKGARNRSVPVPSAAMRATKAYFAARGLNFDEALPEVPLLTSTSAPGAPLSYPALHESFKRFVRRAVRNTVLPLAEKIHAEAASSHWLRHTHATCAAEAGVPPDVLQANLGQSDPRTTAGYYKAQLDRRWTEMERVYGHDESHASPKPMEPARSNA